MEKYTLHQVPWWRHQMETFSALLALCAGNSSITGEFPSQRPVTRSFDVFFDLHLNKRLSKQSWGWWFDTPSRSVWRHCNDQKGSTILQCLWIWNCFHDVFQHVNVYYLFIVVSIRQIISNERGLSLRIYPQSHTDFGRFFNKQVR